MRPPCCSSSLCKKPGYALALVYPAAHAVSHCAYRVRCALACILMSFTNTYVCAQEDDISRVFLQRQGPRGEHDALVFQKPPTISTCLFPNTYPSRRRRTCRTCFRRDRGGAVCMMRHLQKMKKRTAQRGLLLLTWVCRANPTRRRYLACSDFLCILYQVNILPAGHFGCSLLCPSELFVGDPLYSVCCTCGCSVGDERMKMSEAICNDLHTIILSAGLGKLHFTTFLFEPCGTVRAVQAEVWRA